MRRTRFSPNPNAHTQKSNDTKYPNDKMMTTRTTKRKKKKKIITQYIRACLAAFSFSILHYRFFMFLCYCNRA